MSSKGKAKKVKSNSVDVLKEVIRVIMVESVYKPVMEDLRGEFEKVQHGWAELKEQEAFVRQFTDGLLTPCPHCGAYHTVHAFSEDQPFICGACGETCYWRLAGEPKNPTQKQRVKYLLEKATKSGEMRKR